MHLACSDIDLVVLTEAVLEGGGEDAPGMNEHCDHGEQEDLCEQGVRDLCEQGVRGVSRARVRPGEAPLPKGERRTESREQLVHHLRALQNWLDEACVAHAYIELRERAAVRSVSFRSLFLTFFSLFPFSFLPYEKGPRWNWYNDSGIPIPL